MTLGANAGGAQRHEHEHVHTSCGRSITIGRLALGDAKHPAARVFIDLGECPGCTGRAPGWAGLTVPEARQLAAMILDQAAVAERNHSATA